MKTLDKIPTGKIERAGQLVKTGVKLGGNYAKFYGKRILGAEGGREELDQANARDIYDGLKNLKGSALKVAQMLSMERNLLPEAYVERFSLSQFSVPPLSGPLVRKTFIRYFGQAPEDLFDRFSSEAINAASIGQVHKATKAGKELAVKVQYPGVADSISSDLALVKPVALRMFNLKAGETEKYFKEVEAKLLEETDYTLELDQSQAVSKACKAIPNLLFPKYYPEWSSDRILTMDWMQGLHLGEYTATNFSREAGDRLGQTLWNFYMFQIHGLRKVHADPHPGNFLVNSKGELIAIDFGCIKEIPERFYTPYFELADASNIQDEAVFVEKLYELEILMAEDSPEETVFFKDLFSEMLQIFTAPFQGETFDFGDPVFWAQIADLSQRYSKDPQIRKMNGSRGSKHFLYINRTFFGLYNLLHDLKARIKVNEFRQYLD